MRVQRTVLVMFLLCSLAIAGLPISGHAAPFLLTGFVPELATPTLEFQCGYHAGSIQDQRLNVTTMGARIGYVAYPAIEVALDLNYLTYDFAMLDDKEHGLGADLLFRYQVPEILPAFDISAAVIGSFGKSNSINEYGATALVIVSRDIAQGWTPYLEAGLCANRQKFDGGNLTFSVWESRMDPVLVLGVKYLWQNALGVQADTYYQDGLGLEASVSYRF